MSDQTELRTLLTKVETQAAAVASVASTDEERTRAAELGASVAALVKLIGLGPAPELRDCPSCGRSGMRNATLCGYCWTKLAPVEA